MKRIKTVIVDDEPDSINLLRLQLEQNFPQIEIAGTYTSSVTALRDIEILQPDLLILDIEMPVMNGFELLDKIMHLNISVIFITAYNHYAIKAFRFNALDYLVKPFDNNDLKDAIGKAEHLMKPTSTQLSQLQKQLRGERITKIAVSSTNGVTFISLDEIIYSEASNNYTKLILTNKRNFIISKTLKDVQEVLEEEHFLRVHRQYIINLNHVTQFNRNEGLLTMDNGEHIPIARNQKERLAEKYKWL